MFTGIFSRFFNLLYAIKYSTISQRPNKNRMNDISVTCMHMNINLLLLGSFQRHGDEILVTTRLVEGESGIIKPLVQDKFSISNILDVQLLYYFSFLLHSNHIRHLLFLDLTFYHHNQELTISIQ